MDMVKENFRAADIFKKHGINYCCSGKISLEEACQVKNLDYAVIRDEVEEAADLRMLPFSISPREWKLDFLVDYILNVHYAWLKKTLPSLHLSMVSFLGSHKNKYPEFVELTQTFESLVTILMPHIENEEKTIFPYIKQIENALSRKASYGTLLVKTLGKPLGNMEKEHQHIYLLLDELKEGTNNFEISAKNCTNHQVIYNKLAEFYQNMHQLIYLESKHLYPRAAHTEKELLHQ